MKRPKCSFCGNDLYAETPIQSKGATFRCHRCNVRVNVTNASYLDKDFLAFYRFLVNRNLLMKQNNYWDPTDMLPGETINSGAPSTCPDCGKELKEEVLQSAAGYYIGTQCKCGPYSRESHYYKTREAAQKDLDNKTVNYRT